MTMKFTPVGDTKGHLQVGSGLPVEIDTAGNLKAAGKVQAQPAIEAGDVVTFEQAFGVGQTRQNMTAQRTLGVTYTNTTGKPIGVEMHAVGTSSASAHLQITVGSSTLAMNYVRNNGEILSVNAVVLPGESYSYSTGTNVSGVRIMEIR